MGGVAVCYTRPGEHPTPLPRPGLHLSLSGRLPLLQVKPLALPASDAWYVTAYECGVGRPALTRTCLGLWLPMAGCQLQVPSACEVFITADDPQEEGHVGFYDRISSRRCILVFDLETSELIGCNLPTFQDIDNVWNPLEDTGVFDQLTSLSTTRMQLATGRYLVKVAWHSLSTPDTIPDRLVFIMTASIPGLELGTLLEED